MNSPFVIEVIFGEYYHRLCDVHCVKRALNYWRNVPVSVMSADTIHLLPNQTASPRRRRQASQTPEWNMYNFFLIEALLLQLPFILSDKLQSW